MKGSERALPRRAVAKRAARQDGRQDGNGTEMSMVDGMTASATSTGTPMNAGWLRALELTKPILAQPSRILPAIIDAVAEGSPQAPALLSMGECISYRALVERSNRYARWALRQHV